MVGYLVTDGTLEMYVRQTFLSAAKPAFWYGGGGGKTLKCPDRKNNNIHVRVIYMRERAKRVSASETYLYVYIYLLHLYTYMYTINAVPIYLWHHWHGAINDNIPTKHLH